MGGRGGAIPKRVIAAIKAAATSVRVAELLRVDLTREGTTDRLRGRCPLPGHGEQRGRKPGPFVAYEGGGWKCFGCGAGDGDGPSLYQAVRGTDFPETIRALGLSLGISIELPGNGNGARPRATKPRPAAVPVAVAPADPAGEWTASSEPPASLKHRQNGEPSRVWRILDARGRLFALHCRFELVDGKTFRWWRNGQWSLKCAACLKHPTKNCGKCVGVARAPLYGSERLGGWDQGASVIVTEGEKAADALGARGLHAVATVCGSGTTPAPAVLAVLSGRGGPVILWPDNDSNGKGRAHMEHVRAALPAGLVDVRTFAPVDLPDKGDAVEWLATRPGANPGELLGEILAAPERSPAEVDPAADSLPAADVPDISVSLGDLSRKIIPAREDVLAGLLKVGDASCITGQPGRGKSLAAVGISIAVASGGNFAGLVAPKPRGVMYIDGELLEIEVKDRGLKLARGAGLRDPRAIDGLPLRFVVEVSLREESPRLSTPAGRLRIEQLLEQHPETEVLVLDSLRILFGLADENKSETWSPVNDFILAMKRRGLSVLGVHHNSRLDTFNGSLAGATCFSQILNLSARADGEDEQGATALDCSYSKARSLTGAEKVPFGLELAEESDGALYFCRIDASSAKNPKKKAKKERAIDPRRPEALALRAQGVPVREVAERLGCSPTSVTTWTREEREETEGEGEGLTVTKPGRRDTVPPLKGVGGTLSHAKGRVTPRDTVTSGGTVAQAPGGLFDDPEAAAEVRI
jgi:hypothetical protein